VLGRWFGFFFEVFGAARQGDMTLGPKRHRYARPISLSWQEMERNSRLSIEVVVGSFPTGLPTMKIFLAAFGQIITSRTRHDSVRVSSIGANKM
jgi:hypothetical protein